MPFVSGIAQANQTKDRQKHVETHVTKTWNNTDVWGKGPQPRPRSLLWSGGHSRRKTPDPIPNSADKCANANGTASQDVGE
jgi:hypothetical protein